MLNLVSITSADVTANSGMRKEVLLRNLKTTVVSSIANLAAKIRTEIFPGRWKNELCDTKASRRKSV